MDVTSMSWRSHAHINTHLSVFLTLYYYADLLSFYHRPAGSTPSGTVTSPARSAPLVFSLLLYKRGSIMEMPSINNAYGI